MKIVVLDGYALNPGDLSWDELRRFGDVDIHDRTREEGVVAHDAIEKNPPDHPGFRWMPVDNLLAESDVVSLHCPLSAENRGMIHRERLARMKTSAFLLNTSRGPLVVDEDLAAALNSHVI